MSLLMRKRAALWKMESSYGQDSGPTGSANALKISGLEIIPIEGQTVPRELILPYFGGSEQLPTAVYKRATFACEIAGSGTPGTAPPWAPVLRCCGFSEALLAAAVTGQAQAGAVSAITLAAGASSTSDAYLGFRIRIVSGAGAAQARTIIAYDGATKVALVDSPWATNPDATSNYSIDAGAVYTTATDALEAGTGYFNVDGVLHAMLGARGTVRLGFGNNQIPRLEFDMSGIYVPIADSALPTVVVSAWKTPKVVNRGNTPVARLHGVDTAMESLSIDAANDVQFRSLPGSSESVLVTGRQSTGSVSIEATTVAAKDWWSVVRSATLGSAVMEHGTEAGHIVRVTAPAVQLTQPRYADSQGVAMNNFNLTVNPRAGNDEIMICVM